MITVQQLSVRAPKGERILHKLNATIARGTFHVICGPNGGGKTTFLRALCGLIPHEAGVIQFGARTIDSMDERERAQLIAWVSAEQSMNFSYSVRDIVTWGRWVHHRGWPNRNDQKQIDAALEAMKIADFSNRKITELSLGEQKRVHLARAIAGDTPYVILDEPCGPLDAGVTLDVMEWIRFATTTLGKTVVASLHDVPLIANFADAVTLLAKGAILAHGKTSEVLVDTHLEAGLGIQIRQTETGEGKLILLVRPN